VVLLHPDGKSAYVEGASMPKRSREKVARPKPRRARARYFSTGEVADDAAVKTRDYAKSFFTTYNRTDVQERVQDIITACAFAHTHSKGRRVVLCGQGRAGLWALLAAPASDAIIADCAQLDSSNDRELLSQDLFAPGLRRLAPSKASPRSTPPTRSCSTIPATNSRRAFSAPFIAGCTSRNVSARKPQR
jgi:hypothetical protein